jgi:SAM-dependent methyltransferase
MIAMQTAVYEVEDAVEANHWWFVGRRALLRSLLKRSADPSQSRVLDIGTGTGGNLRLLRELGFQSIDGIDFSEDAIEYCRQKGFEKVQLGDACRLPFEDNSFDVTLATDVLEHLEDDHQAAREIARVLKPGGLGVITVPAFPCLWGLQDEVACHVRRYRMRGLLACLDQAGLEIEKRFHFNYLLFGSIWLARQVIRLAKIPLRSENELNSPFLNAILKAIFTVDVHSAKVLHPPFGVSICVLARKPGESSSHG